MMNLNLMREKKKQLRIGFIRLDPLTGLITTVKPLDREAKSTYKIIIEVFDQGLPPQSATRVLRINVLDIDDHRPRFAREIVSDIISYHCINFFP